MYFHLIWIKEKLKNKYDLDFLLEWWDEDFIRNFLANRWVVIVSINEFKEDPQSFWNIVVNTDYNWVNIQLITKWDNLSDVMFFIISLWLRPLSINFVTDPIPEDKMKVMIDSTILAVEEEDKKAEQQLKFEEFQEKKKYEEKWLKEWLRIINLVIDRIEQVIKAGKWVISWNELKKLKEISDEMKKIRLWTNFNKMVSLVLDSQVLLKNAEKEIFNANTNNSFLINKNSSVTNIDVLKNYFDFNRIYEKIKLQPSTLTTTESIMGTMWENSILLNLLWQDISYSVNNYSLGEFTNIVIKISEYIVLLIILVIALSWLVSPLLWIDKFSLYLLPAMWWLWLLIYLYRNLELKSITAKIIWFIVLVLVYRRGLILLLNTFAL